MVKHASVAIFSLSLGLAPAVVAAQQSGSAATETVASIRERDVNGAERVTEKVVTRRSPRTDGEEVIIETYLPLVYEGRLVLAERVRRVTTVTTYGSQIVEDIEEAPRGSPHDPMRTVRRSLTTIRQSGPDEYVIERRLFERDTNGRFVPTETQIERSSRK